jgi:hypothetical protein
MTWTTGMYFSCMGQCSLGLLRLLAASAFTLKVSAELLQRCQVSKAHVDANIIAVIRANPAASLSPS